MTSAIEGRKRKTSWMSDSTRAEMLRRYADLLEVNDETTLRDFFRWVVDDAQYLAAEGNFQMFCHVYLAAELDEAPSLWDMVGEGTYG